MNIPSETQFRELADAAPVLIWRSDVDKHCGYFKLGGTIKAQPVPERRSR